MRPPRKKSRRAPLLCLIQFSVVLLSVNRDLNGNAVLRSRRRRIRQHRFSAVAVQPLTLDDRGKVLVADIQIDIAADACDLALLGMLPDGIAALDVIGSVRHERGDPLCCYWSSVKVKISSTVVPKSFAISIASFREGLYCPFSSRMIVSRRTPVSSASSDWLMFKRARCSLIFVNSSAMDLFLAGRCAVKEQEQDAPNRKHCADHDHN